MIEPHIPFELAADVMQVAVDVDVEGVIYHTTVPYYLARDGAVIEWPIERDNGDLTVIEVPIVKVYPPRDSRQDAPDKRSLSDAECLSEIADIVGKSCDEDVIMAVERVLASATKQLQKADAENLRLREDMEAAQTAFVILHEKWLTAEKRQDMNEAMDALSAVFRHGSLNEEIDGFIPCPNCGRDPESVTCHCKPIEDFEG